jgi:hypothetical protein
MQTGYKAMRVVLLVGVIKIYLGRSFQAAWENLELFIVKARQT